VTSSSGNFAQAVAYAAAQAGIRATIVMMRGTSPLKVARTKALGATVVECDPTFDARWETTARLQQELGATLLHPYDSPATIRGNGTLGLEILEQIDGDFECYVPVSGGGLVAGIALALKAMRPGCRVYGVQSEANPSAVRSFEAGKRVRLPEPKTIADALVAPIPGELAFEMHRIFVDGFLTVSEEEIRNAMRRLFEVEKLVVEPGGAVPYAAALKAKSTRPLVVVASGSNVAWPTT